jgi:hypothetical protein
MSVLLLAVLWLTNHTGALTILKMPPDALALMLWFGALSAFAYFHCRK